MPKAHNKNNKNNDKAYTNKNFDHSSDNTKEIARLKKELKDTQDALEILKKAIDIVEKNSE